MGALKVNIGGNWIPVSSNGVDGIGVPPGGNAGQVLVKSSDVDYITQWATVAPVQGVYLPLAGGTMTGQLTMNAPAGSEQIKFSNAGDYMGWWRGSTRDAYIQSNGTDGLIIYSEGGELNLSSASGYVRQPYNIRTGLMTNYGGSYGGIGWSNGSYLVMSDASNTFVSTPSNGTLFLRAGTNGCYQLELKADGNHSMVGNLGLGGYSVQAEAFNAGWTGIWFGGANLSGWYIDGSSAWIRSRNSYGTWLGSGRFGSDGGLTLGFGGGGNDAGHIADISGYMRVTQRIDCGGISCGDASFGSLTTNHISSRDGYRFTSNGSYNGWYYNSGYLTQKQSGGDRAHFGCHPGGVAYNWGATSASPGLACWTLDSGGVSPIYASDFVYSSTRKTKQDIVAWPLQSVGAGALSAVDRLDYIDVVQYRKLKEQSLQVALPDRRARAFARLNAWRERQGLEPHPWPLHDCDNHPWCDGTSAEPCSLVRNWENPTIGVVIDDMASVLPEAVQIDVNGDPEGLRSTAMIGFLIAVCKEQQSELQAMRDRLERLEQRGTLEALAA